MAQTVFRRNEKKYVLAPTHRDAVIAEIEWHMARDKYYQSTIHNVYFDTATDELVTASLEQPNYKYKVRARSYGAASKGTVFLEIKLKLDGTVYKRRAQLSEDEYAAYLRGHMAQDGQVMRELTYLFATKQLRPKVYIGYNRLAYKATDGSDLRVTFDTNLCSRTDRLNLTERALNNAYFDDDSCIMEIKTKGGMPQWLVDFLSAHDIYPSSFSKYGKIYQKLTQREPSYAY